MSKIEKSCYKSNDKVCKKKPMLIGCSGGGGHIAAIQGIIGYLEMSYGGDNNLNLTAYNPVLFEDKPSSRSRDQIAMGMKVMHIPVIGPVCKAATSLTFFPVLPKKEKISTEITSLSENNLNKRQYIDMLLDVFPAGYESAAIWNTLQRDDKISELKKLIRLQHSSDSSNYNLVHDYYLTTLKRAALDGKPFTEIISTQAIALSALCDAAEDYNFWIKQQNIDASIIFIHQYMTDLPTKGAVHFFNPLTRLSQSQQRQMKLYGVEMNKEIINYFFPRGHEFSGIFDIPAQENPMVRQGFKNPSFDNSAYFEKEVTINLAEETHTIKENEQIAAIMLGSQAGHHTYDYIETLLKNGLSKVFIFGGKTNSCLKMKIDNLLVLHPEYQGRLISLGNQEDVHITSLMSRSNIVIIRGGGLSVMEQLAMKHNFQQTVLIHHANSHEKELSSGIPWEDANVELLIKKLKSTGVHCEKTSPERANRHIGESRLIAKVKKHEKNIDPEDAYLHIQRLSNENLNIALNLITEAEDVYKPSFPKELLNYFEHREREAQEAVKYIADRLNKILNNLEIIITNEVNVYEYDFFKKNSRKLISATQAFDIFMQLKDILLKDNSLSENRKLTQFKNEYMLLEADRIYIPNKNVILQWIENIFNILTQYFHSSDRNLSPEQEIKEFIFQ